MTLSRRALMAAAALLPAAGWEVVAAASAQAAPSRPSIRPRPDWADGLEPVGVLEDEPDVRFLLVHHTLTPNTDAAEKIPERLRSIFRYHTSAEKGWPDVAYNFFVDRFGTIWEGRQGSLERAVQGDASGGSQGFAQLCCFVGDFTAEPPSAAAMDAMVALLAWLAGREGLDLVAPVTFVSRGSSRWRAGTEVTTAQVAGHRDMSATECPGDGLYPLVAQELLPRARALLAPSPSPSAASATPTPSASAPATGGAPDAAGADTDVWPRVLGGVGVAAGAAGMLLAARGRRGTPASGAEQLADDDDPADGERGQQADEEADRGA